MSRANLSPDQVKTRLTSDCAQCASLCCVSLHIEKSAQFAINKPAGTPCPNLRSNGLCKIHTTLSEAGFDGCVAYDCHGAGQRVVQDLFDGVSWQKDASLLPQMSEDFSKMRRIYRWLELISTARALPLSTPLSAECDALLRLFCPPQSWTRASFDAHDEPRSKAQATAFLYQLRDVI